MYNSNSNRRIIVTWDTEVVGVQMDMSYFSFLVMDGTVQIYCWCEELHNLQSLGATTEQYLQLQRTYYAYHKKTLFQYDCPATGEICWEGSEHPDGIKNFLGAHMKNIRHFENLHTLLETVVELLYGGLQKGIDFLIAGPVEYDYEIVYKYVIYKGWKKTMKIIKILGDIMGDKKIKKIMLNERGRGYTSIENLFIERYGFRQKEMFRRSNKKHDAVLDCVAHLLLVV